MNMKIFQSVHGKQKFKFINNILLKNICNTEIIISKCINNNKKINLSLKNHSLLKNSTKNLYYIQQIIEQLSLSNGKNLIKFC